VNQVTEQLVQVSKIAADKANAEEIERLNKLVESKEDELSSIESKYNTLIQRNKAQTKQISLLEAQVIVLE
jgi:hypothetical protein